MTPDYSVLITCYFEQESILEFHARLAKTMQELGRSYEIIFVNDGSTDRTFELLREIFAKDPNVTTIIDMVKNSGQQAAITAAMVVARGKAMVLMDSDLQLAPEELPTLVAEFEKGVDIVSGYRKNRKDSWSRTIPSRLANMIMRRASRSDFRDFGCTFKIYNAEIVRAFEYGPRRIFANVDLIAACGRRVEVPVSHFPRKYGKSGYTFAKLWTYNIDNVVTLSERPFQVLGGMSVVFALLLVLRVIGAFFFSGNILSSVSNGLILNVVFGSLFVNLALFSAIGEFAIRSFFIGRWAPRYIIRTLLTRVEPR